MTRIVVVELNLHDYRPDIDTDVEDDDGEETNLSTAALAEALHIENKAKAKAADTGKKSN